MLRIKSAAVLLVLALAAGCTGTPLNFGVAPATPTQHLYVADGASGGLLRQYALPLTASSTATALLANAPHSIGVAANASVVAEAAIAGPIRIFTQTVSSSSAVAASFGVFNTFPAFGSAGQLYTGPVTNGTTLAAYTPPFSNATVPSSTIAYPIGVSSVAVDASGNVYVNNGSTGIAVATSGGTITASATVAGRFYREMAASATQLFACDVSSSVQANGVVDVFTLPLTNASAPAFSIKTGANGPEGCALDSSGNLYVANILNATITVYAPPFSASSAPTVTVTGDPSTMAFFGIAVGP
jgi:hypothetical protein